MPKATWNGKVIAQADASEVQLVEGNVYFPPGKVEPGLLPGGGFLWWNVHGQYDVVGD